MQVMLPLDLLPAVNVPEAEQQSPGFEDLLAALSQNLAAVPEEGEFFPLPEEVSEEERQETDVLLLALLQLGSQSLPQAAEPQQAFDHQTVSKAEGAALSPELPRLAGKSEIPLGAVEKLILQDPELFEKIISALEKLAKNQQGVPQEAPGKAQMPEEIQQAISGAFTEPQQDLPILQAREELQQVILKALEELSAGEKEAAAQKTEAEEPALLALIPEAPEEKPKALVFKQQPGGKAELSLLQPEEGIEAVSQLPVSEVKGQQDLPSEKRRAPEPQAEKGDPEGFFAAAEKSPEPLAPKVEKLEAPYRPREFQAILSKAVVRVGEKVQELAVKIQPQSLGKVLLKVAVEEDGKMVAKFVTENSQAKGILELNLPQLREALAKEGLQLARCEVALAWSGEFGERERRERMPYPRSNQIYHYEEQQLSEAPTPVQQTGGVNYLV